MKRTNVREPRRVFARTKARTLDADQLKQVSGGMPIETHFFCGGAECDGSDSW